MSVAPLTSIPYCLVYFTIKLLPIWKNNVLLCEIHTLHTFSFVIGQIKFLNTLLTYCVCTYVTTGDDEEVVRLQRFRQAQATSR